MGESSWDPKGYEYNPFYTKTHEKSTKTHENHEKKTGKPTKYPPKSTKITETREHPLKNHNPRKKTQKTPPKYPPIHEVTRLELKTVRDASGKNCRKKDDYYILRTRYIAARAQERNNSVRCRYDTRYVADHDTCAACCMLALSLIEAHT